MWRYRSYILNLGLIRSLHIPSEIANNPGVDLLEITQNHGYKRTLNENAELWAYPFLAGHSNLWLYTVTVTLPLV